jgi:mannose-6-phosphate isomerase
MKTGAEVKQKPRLTHYFPVVPERSWAVANTLRLSEFRSRRLFLFCVENSFQVLLCVDGDGGLGNPGRRRPMRYKKGDCIFLLRD